MASAVVFFLLLLVFSCFHHLQLSCLTGKKSCSAVSIKWKNVVKILIFICQFLICYWIRGLIYGRRLFPLAYKRQSERTNRNSNSPQLTLIICLLGCGREKKKPTPSLWVWRWIICDPLILFLCVVCFCL